MFLIRFKKILNNAYIVMLFVLGIYKLGLSSIYPREYLTIPPIIEKSTMHEKM